MTMVWKWQCDLKFQFVIVKKLAKAFIVEQFQHHTHSLTLLCVSLLLLNFLPGCFYFVTDFDEDRAETKAKRRNEIMKY
jgi:hypothetical protein